MLTSHVCMICIVFPKKLICSYSNLDTKTAESELKFIFQQRSNNEWLLKLLYPTQFPVPSLCYVFLIPVFIYSIKCGRRICEHLPLVEICDNVWYKLCLSMCKIDSLASFSSCYKAISMVLIIMPYSCFFQSKIHFISK